MRYAIIVIIAATLLLLSAASAEAQLRPGILPGVYKGYVASGPPMTVTYQPMQRVRIRTIPWWRRFPPVIYYPLEQRPACHGCTPRQQPTWGRFGGEWGYGQSPDNSSSNGVAP